MLCCSELSESGCPACLAETNWGPTLSSRACQQDSNSFKPHIIEGNKTGNLG